MTSQSIPASDSSFAASSVFGSEPPYVMTVTSDPERRIAAREMSVGPRFSDVGGGVVELDVLENHHRIGVGQRRAEHAVCILHRRGGHHLDAWDVGIPTLEAV